MSIGLHVSTLTTAESIHILQELCAFKVTLNLPISAQKNYHHHLVYFYRTYRRLGGSRIRSVVASVSCIGSACHRVNVILQVERFHFWGMDLRQRLQTSALKTDTRGGRMFICFIWYINTFCVAKFAFSGVLIQWFLQIIHCTCT